MKPTKKLRLAGYLLGLILSGALLTGCGKQIPVDFKGAPLKDVSHKFGFSVLSQQEAQPGRVIRATAGGQVQATYTCKAFDAAVALVYISDINQSSILTYDVGAGTDENGNKYSTGIQSKGNWCFITIHSGFSKLPSRVEVPLQVFPVHPISSAKPVVEKVVFSKFSPPHRYFSPPTGQDLINGEKFVTAKTFGKFGDFEIRVKSGMSANASVSGLPFSQDYFAPEYFSQSDAARITLRPYTTQETETTLVYRHAKILTRNGSRLLVLPTGQEVGTIGTRIATIAARPNEISAQLDFKHSTGTIAVALAAPTSVDSGGRAGYQDQPTCVGIFPSLKDMGLERVDVGIVGQPNKRFAEASPNRNSQLNDIPELRLKVHTKTLTYGKELHVVVPIHHFAARPGTHSESERATKREAEALTVTTPLNLR